MLRPFIFVGCGGSGVRTVTAIHNFIKRSLEDVGYVGGIPDAFQFLVVDVPANMQEPLPSRINYISLTDATTVWAGKAGVDHFLAGNPNVAVRNDYLTWRPNPNHLSPVLKIGAGQFRAVGRALSAKQNKNFSNQFNQAINKANAGGTALTGVGQALGFSTQQTAPAANTAPVILLISSLGGGAGSGIFLDIAELIRIEGQGHLASIHEQLISVLYDPSVFDTDNDDVEESGIPGNSLAAISELVAASWAKHKVSPHLSAGTPEIGEFNGPQYTFLVGTTNGETTNLESPMKIYETTARTICSWVLNPSIASHFDEITLGNWTMNALESSFAHHQVDGQSIRMPISAMGYSRLDMGRVRFKRFAVENVVRSTVEHLVNKHTEFLDIESGQPPELAIRQYLRSNMSTVYSFLTMAGLNENSQSNKNQNNNDILDAIRLPNLSEELKTRVKEITVDFAKYSSLNSLENEVDGEISIQKIGEIKIRHQSSILEWASSVQSRFSWAVIDALAIHGIRIVEGILEESVKLLTEEFPTQLIAEKNSGELLESKAEWENRNVKPAFKGKKNDRISNSHLDVIEAIVEARLTWNIERDLRDLVSEICKDIASNLIAPALTQLRNERENIEEEIKYDEYRLMSEQRRPAEYLLPTANEILIDDANSWGETLKDLLEMSSKTLATLTTDILKGNLGQNINRQSIESNLMYSTIRPWTKSENWVPKIAATLNQAAPSKSEVRFNLSIERIKSRAYGYFQYPVPGESKIVDYCRESMNDYLNDSTLNDAARRNRLKDFCEKLGKAIGNSDPLVEVRWNWVETRYGHNKKSCIKRFTSRIPLPSPGTSEVSNEIARVLNSELGSEMPELFGLGTETFIEIFSCYRPMPAANYFSLSNPIVNSKINSDAGKNSGNGVFADPFFDARRSRPFEDYLPLAPEVRLTFARGWTIGILTGRIEPGKHEEFDPFSGLSVSQSDFTRAIHVSSSNGVGTLPLLYPPVGSFASSSVDFHDVAAMTSTLNSALAAEMYASTGQSSEHFDAFLQVINLGMGKVGTATFDYEPARTADMPLLIWVANQGKSIEERQEAVRETAASLHRKTQQLRDAEVAWFKNQSPTLQYRPFPLEFQLSDVYVTAVEQVANYLLSLVQ